MRWFRRTWLWASLGCLGAATPASAQVSLGRPTPLELEPSRVVNAFQPIAGAPSAPVQQAGYVVRGARPTSPDEPNGLPSLDEAKHLPWFAPTMQPAQAAQPRLLEKIGVAKVATPAVDATERIIILPDGEACSGDVERRTLFGGLGLGERRLYAQGEWLLWTTRGFHLPPLATTASANDDPDTRAALGFQTTRLIYGDSNVLGGLRSGARLTVGYDFDPCGLCTIEGSFFFLGQKSASATFASDAFPVVGRPFFNINTGLQDRELTTTPEFTSGNLQVRTSSSLFGAEVNKRVLLWHGCEFELSGLVGFRYLDLNEHLNIEERTTFINAVPAVGNNPPLFNAGDRTFVFDRFDTHNRFYGGQFGLNAQWLRGPWSLDARCKLGLGVTHQAIGIDGGQRFDRANGTVQTFRGGLYALPTNIGQFAQARFAVVPEVGCKVGYNLTDNIRLFVGYDFLYWSSVARPGDQIDTALDANRIPNFGANFPAATQVRPVVQYRTSSYFAHGLNAGVEIRY